MTPEPNSESCPSIMSLAMTLPSIRMLTHGGSVSATVLLVAGKTLPCSPLADGRGSVGNAEN